MAADYYSVLGLSRGASQEEIRKAYKKIARENHPDRKPGDAAASEKFKQAAEAYEVLGDPEKRKKYDQFGPAWKQAEQMRGNPYGGGSGPVDVSEVFGDGGIDLGDLFGGMFGRGAGGGRTRRTSARRGADIETSIQIPFQMAATGGSYEVSVQRGGRIERLTVKIPPGVEEGARLRVAHEGDRSASGGPSGDLLVTVHIAPHPFFRREGDDVQLDLPLTVGEAVLGAKVTVPTLRGEQVTLTVPPGTSSGARLRIKGEGFPDRKTGERGHQYAVVKIIVPKQVSDEARTALEQFEAATKLSPRAGLWG